MKQKTFILPCDVHGCCQVKGTRHGSVAIFMIRDGVGVKMFGDEDQRDEVMERQGDAWEHGLAPEVHGPCRVLWVRVNGTVQEWYGYLTEIADMNHGCEPRHHSCVPMLGDIEGLQCEVSEDYNDLICEIHHIYGRCAIGDLHTGNIGRVEGKLVCVDWGWDDQ